MLGTLVGAYSKRALVVAPSGRPPHKFYIYLEELLVGSEEHQRGGRFSGLDMSWAFSNTMYDFP